MDKPKERLHPLLTLILILLLLLLSPIILLWILASIPQILRDNSRDKKKYKSSRYYADFGKKYAAGIPDSPAYRFYNAAMRRELPIRYVRQEANDFDYFIRDGIIYIFPDFEQIEFIDEESAWYVSYDGEPEPFDQCCDRLLSMLEGAPEHPVRLLVERKMFSETDLNGMDIPNVIFIIWSYENAFENEDLPCKMTIPQSAEALYDMMLRTPDLCGIFALDETGRQVLWDLNESIRICIDPSDCYFGVSKKRPGKADKNIVHWYSSMFEIYDEVCRIGKRGNVMVLRSSWLGGAVLYYGSKADCPYPKSKRSLLGKYEYQEAR